MRNYQPQFRGNTTTTAKMRMSACTLTAKCGIGSQDTFRNVYRHFWRCARLVILPSIPPKFFSDYVCISLLTLVAPRHHENFGPAPHPRFWTPSRRVFAEMPRRALTSCLCLFVALRLIVATPASPRRAPFAAM